MIAKAITNQKFREAIRTSFKDDNAIYALYCPRIHVASVDDIVEDISHRICGETKSATIMGVFEKNELVGYYVFEKHTLISFALSVRYRTRKYLNNLFALIRADLKGDMQSFLWSRNVRAIKYLCKHGMKIISSNELITHLIL